MQAGERVMRPEVRARPGRLAPLGRLWVGEGAVWGRGGVVTATAGGGWGWGLKDVGWRFPALCTAGWGPLPAVWCPRGQAQTH